MRFSSSWPVLIAAWRGPSRMSRRGRASSSWNARAYHFCARPSPVGAGTAAVMNSSSKPPCPLFSVRGPAGR